MKSPKKVYVCSECDYQAPKWLGKCPECGSWNSFVEEMYVANNSPSAVGTAVKKETAVLFGEMDGADCERRTTGIGELDRVLGGGLVVGSVVLLAGEPGIGKSTLLMQLCGKLADKAKVLYVSGEESKGQLKIRADRLGVSPSGLYILTDTDVETLLSEYGRISPDVLIVDSIQTMSSERSSSAPGSIAQVRECASAIMSRAKKDGVSVILVGHVNKEGGIAGPKVLEHMVDAVL